MDRLQEYEVWQGSHKPGNTCRKHRGQRLGVPEKVDLTWALRMGEVLYMGGQRKPREASKLKCHHVAEA